MNISKWRFCVENYFRILAAQKRHNAGIREKDCGGHTSQCSSEATSLCDRRSETRGLQHSKFEQSVPLEVFVFSCFLNFFSIDPNFGEGCCKWCTKLFIPEVIEQKRIKLRVKVDEQLYKIWNTPMCTLHYLNFQQFKRQCVN